MSHTSGTASTSVPKPSSQSQARDSLSNAQYDRLSKTARARFNRKGELSEEFQERACDVCTDVEVILHRHGIVTDVDPPRDLAGNMFDSRHELFHFRKTDAELHSVEIGSLDVRHVRGKFHCTDTLVDVRGDAYSAIADAIQKRAELLAKVAGEIRALSGKAVRS